MKEEINFIPNRRINEFRCERCKFIIRYFPNHTKEVQCASCKKEYKIGSFEIIMEKKILTQRGEQREV